MPHVCGFDHPHRSKEATPMKHIPAATAFGLALCTASLALAQTPPSQQPGTEPGEVRVPTEALPTQGTTSSVTPIPAHVEVHFAPDSTVISDSERENVTRLAELCRKGPASTVVLAGYPDGSGDPRQTIALSFQRATAVMEALIARHDFQSFGWQLSAETMPEQHAAQRQKVIGHCR
jgi:outer membrane protein OmpA-like peptidoglycan-associated protein